LNEKVPLAALTSRNLFRAKALLSNSVSASLDVTIESTVLMKEQQKAPEKLLFHQLNYSFDAFFYQRWDQRVSLVLALSRRLMRDENIFRGKKVQPQLRGISLACGESSS
jgi:CRISPR/Cas system CMR-associated protein Cmr3 (group 5 of RAMP superfamily)